MGCTDSRSIAQLLGLLESPTVPLPRVDRGLLGDRTQVGRRSWREACIAHICQEVQAIVINKAQAEVLRAEPSSPALKITRRYLDSAGEAFEISVSAHLADWFNFSMQMERARE